uniref:MAT1-1-2 n=1 Tax=Ephelis japonica TaxID=116609 RepID=Q5TL95_9HYPO|nr:MAT1-1-2 [Ephelis japonica]
MENIYHFTPLWHRIDLICKPDRALEAIRIKSLQTFLDKYRIEVSRPLSLDGMFFVSECIWIIQQLLEDHTDDNEILRRLRELEQNDSLKTVRNSLNLWYDASCPIFSRDPHQGLPPDTELEDESGASILTWSRRFFHQQHAIGNLGFMAMLMTSEVWVLPRNGKLKAASLISAATTTILFASYLIYTDAVQHECACTLDATSAQSFEAMTLFIRSSWQVARTNSNIFDSPPGREFGATLSEVRLSNDGKRFLTRVGHKSWCEAPYWHPCRRVPGSVWNKYLKNLARPIFPIQFRANNKLHISLPNTIFSLIQLWETYYHELRDRFDQVCISPISITVYLLTLQEDWTSSTFEFVFI